MANRGPARFPPGWEGLIRSDEGGALRNKQQITLRIDSDVLEFFKNSSQRYQTRINSVLRAYVNALRRQKQKAQIRKAS